VQQAQTLVSIKQHKLRGDFVQARAPGLIGAAGEADFEFATSPGFEVEPLEQSALLLQVPLTRKQYIRDEFFSAWKLLSNTPGKLFGTAGFILALSLIMFGWSLEFLLANFFDYAGSKLVDAEQVPEARKFLHALSFARYLVAWHVVLEHFWLRELATPTSGDGETWAIVARWGVLAAPFFFHVERLRQ
jgi:hypothetical protein